MLSIINTLQLFTHTVKAILPINEPSQDFEPKNLCNEIGLLNRSFGRYYSHTHTANFLFIPSKRILLAPHWKMVKYSLPLITD